MKAIGIVALALSATLLSFAAAPQTRPVRSAASLQLSAPDGQSFASSQLQRAETWLLVVIDPAIPSGAAMLHALSARETIWDDRLVILLLRDSPASVEQIRAEPKLAAARVLIAADGGALRQLDLPGVPAVLGMRPNLEAAWVRAGLPTQPGRLESQLSGWLRLSPAAPSEN